MTASAMGIASARSGLLPEKAIGPSADGGSDAADIGLIKIGAHAGHVAHVVAHVVGNDGGVAGVVLGDAGLHLAHEVGAHVGRLGEDAAAHAGEQGHGGSAHAEGEPLVEGEPSPRARSWKTV